MSQVQKAVQKLYEVVESLEALYPGRPFTPDGHMVGSLGECLVADAYDLILMPPSNMGYDAVAGNKRKVEIKATQSNSVAFRSKPTHCIAVHLKKNGTFEEIYNGPGDKIWQAFADRPRPSNGQYKISLTRLRRLQQSVPDEQKLPRIALTDASTQRVDASSPDRLRQGRDY
ncbi:MAG TPA: hypothetical protein VMT94_06395 [Burkholderiales bacterium]|nr:hypothetical protein [Burkholderiales bacterium]